MSEETEAEQCDWMSLDRGPTQNAGYAIGGVFMAIIPFGIIARAFNGLPFDLDFWSFTAKLAAFSAAVMVISAIYLKRWRIFYNGHEVVTERFATLKAEPVHYALKDMTAISCFFSRTVMPFGLPFDTLVFEFQDKWLTLRTSDWKRESLKQMVCDLMSYRNDLPRDPLLLNYIAGEYDDIFRG